MDRWWNNLSKGFLLVLSGPSGVGKGTVCDKLLKENKGIVYSISATTRDKRPGEVNGEDYFFVTEEEFKQLIIEGKMLEYAHVHQNMYGTPKDFVFEKINEGEIVILEIDVQGAMQVKKVYNEAVFVFLLPPTMNELKNRIIGRNTESEESIEIRYKNAFKELNFVEEYDYFVVNENIEQAVNDIENIISAEKHRVKRFKYIKEKVIGEKYV